MIRRTPRSTRTDTLFPYTTLFRSPCQIVSNAAIERFEHSAFAHVHTRQDFLHHRIERQAQRLDYPAALAGKVEDACAPVSRIGAAFEPTGFLRSEERRVGKECVSTCRSRWSQYH